MRTKKVRRLTLPIEPRGRVERSVVTVRRHDEAERDELGMRPVDYVHKASGALSCIDGAKLTPRQFKMLSRVADALTSLGEALR